MGLVVMGVLMERGERERERERRRRRKVYGRLPKRAVESIGLLSES